MDVATRSASALFLTDSLLRNFSAFAQQQEFEVICNAITVMHGMCVLLAVPGRKVRDSLQLSGWEYRQEGVLDRHPHGLTVSPLQAPVPPVSWSPPAHFLPFS